MTDSTVRFTKHPGELGVLHGERRDAVEFYTDQKVVIERWPKEWSRKF